MKKRKSKRKKRKKKQNKKISTDNKRAQCEHLTFHENLSNASPSKENSVYKLIKENKLHCNITK